MATTISFDLTAATPAHRNYVRSALERFGWKRLGGSVFRYPSRQAKAETQDDWLNDVVPSLMFFRSYIKSQNIQLSRFTIDGQSCSFFEQDEDQFMLDLRLKEPAQMAEVAPSNPQSSLSAIQDFLVKCVAAAP